MLSSMKQVTRWFLLALFVAGGAQAQDGGIEVFAGETIFVEGSRVSITETWLRREGLVSGGNSVPDPLDRTYEEWRTVLGVNHGFARGWSLSLLVPLVRRSLDSITGSLTGEGLGDASVLLKHNIHVENWERSAWNTAWIAGVETPTGESGERDNGLRLSPSLQPSSGSWDPFVGIASTLDIDLWRFDFVALYKENGEGAQDYEEGDKLTVALSGKYRFLHEVYPGPSASFTLGLKWSDAERASFQGNSVADSGGQELLLKTALGYHPRPDIDLSLSVDSPLDDDRNGTQLSFDQRVQLSFGWRF